MDLEELKRSAESGDIQAIGTLVNYYFDKKDDRETQIWSEKGAALGYAWFAEIAMGMRQTDALACELTGDWEGALSSWQKDLAYAMQVLQNQEYLRAKLQQQGEEKYQQTLDRIDEHLCDAIYGAGLALWRLKRYSEVIENFEGLHPDTFSKAFHQKAQVLVGISAFSLAAHSPNPASEKSLWDKCLKALDVVDVSSNYIPESRDEQINFMRAVLDLSTLYRLGGGVVSQSTEHAHNIIERAMDKVTEQDVNAELLKELSRYRKRLLGGYAYSQ